MDTEQATGGTYVRIRIPGPLHRNLKKLAKSTSRTLSTVVLEKLSPAPEPVVYRWRTGDGCVDPVLVRRMEQAAKIDCAVQLRVVQYHGAEPWHCFEVGVPEGVSAGPLVSRLETALIRRFGDEFGVKETNRGCRLRIKTGSGCAVCHPPAERASAEGLPDIPYDRTMKFLRKAHSLDVEASDKAMRADEEASRAERLRTTAGRPAGDDGVSLAEAKLALAHAEVAEAAAERYRSRAEALRAEAEKARAKAADADTGF